MELVKLALNRNQNRKKILMISNNFSKILNKNSKKKLKNLLIKFQKPKLKKQEERKKAKMNQ